MAKCKNDFSLMSDAELLDCIAQAKIELCDRKQWMDDWNDQPLTVRTQNILIDAGIVSKDEFLSFFSRKGAKIEGVGKKTMSEIRETFSRLSA